MKELDLLRQELLSCDTQLVDILMKRFDVVEKIMALKEKNQMQILQPEQESRQKEALDIELKGNVHQEEIADIAYSIGQVFRMSLNRGNGMITVMKECEIIQYYIELQEKRFENRLTFELDVEPAAFNAIIPKLIIQPIIENSILHGVNDSTSAVHIMVTIRLIQNSTRLEIIVQDDGVGIPLEVLELLPDRLSEGHTSTSSSGFALKNISDRLRLTYNNNYVFDIKSVPGSFTSSRIVVDYHTEMPATQNMPK